MSTNDPLVTAETPYGPVRVPALDEVLSCFELAPQSDGVFTAPSLYVGTGRIFGGQVLGQVVMGAAAAVPTKQVKSVHAVFARNGVAPDPVSVDVAVLHDGGTFATCDVRVAQEGRVLADATVSLHVPGEGPAQQSATRPERDPRAAPPVPIAMIPCETRVPGGVDLRDPAVGPAAYTFWLRSAQLDGPPALHQALFAYASDLTPIGTALRAIPGLSQADTRHTLQSATTSHTVWFHHEVDLADWVCLDQTAPVTGQGRSFVFGNAFRRDGVAVASYAQESLIRWLEANPGEVPRTQS